MPALRVEYSGRVQGVGFRAGVKAVARGFAVVGTVRNLENGRVRLEVQADGAEELEAFLAGVRGSHLGGFIRDEWRQELPPLTGSAARGFAIVR